MKFSRYLLVRFLQAFLLVSLAVVLIFLVIDFVGNIRAWLGKGWEVTLEYYLNYLPYMFYLTLPISLLIAVVASLGTMARYLELVAAQGAGRSPILVLSPVFAFGLFLSLGMFIMGETILPDSNYRRLELVQPTGKRAVKRIKERSQFAYVTTHQSWYFQHYSAPRQEARKAILLQLKEGRIIERFDAQNMRWVLDSATGKGSWILEQGFQRVFSPSGEILVKSFQKKNLAGLVTLMPEDLIYTRQTGDEMNSRMIRERLQAQRRSGESTTVLETQLHFKYSGPFVAIVTLLLGASLAHRYSRSGSITTKFGIGLLLSFAYYVSIKVGLQMGEAGVLSPLLGAWIANGVFGVLGLFLLWRSLRI